MKKMIVGKATNVASLPECWVLTKGEDADFYELVNSKVSRKLPTIHKRAKPILEKFKLSYRNIGNSKIEYWDPKFEEIEELELPVYMYVFNEYVYQKEQVTGEIFSKSMVENAWKWEKAVRAEYEVLKKKERKAALKENMKGKSYALINQKQMKGNTYNHKEEIKDDKNHFYIFKLFYMNGNFSGMYLVFDWYQIYSPVLEIEVPKKYAPMVIGKKGKIINEMTAKLGLRRIEIKKKE